MKAENTEEYWCPVNDFSCPYWAEEGKCTIEDPMGECEEYFAYNYEDPDEPDMLIISLDDPSNIIECKL